MDHGHTWFSVHASQRLLGINYFLVASAFLATAYTSTIEKFPGVSSVVGLVGFMTALRFHQLDLRTRELIKLSESAVMSLEERLADLLSMPELNIIARSNKRASDPEERTNTYSETIMGLLVGMAVLFFGGFVYAIARCVS